MSDTTSGLDDFPDCLGAMLVKELRQSIRGKGFVIPFVGVHVAMLLAFLIDLQAKQFGEVSNMTLFAGIGYQGAFWSFAAALLIGLMPMAALNSLSSEYESRSGELLFLAGLSRWGVIRGKWMTHCALAWLTATTMLPYLLVRYFLGGMDLVATLGVATSVLFLNAAANALAIGLSGYRHVGMRVMVAGVMLGSGWFSCMIIVYSSGAMFHMLARIFKIDGWLPALTGGVFGFAAFSFLFCAFGLQLARLHIRPYLPPSKDLPLESATTGGIVALLVLAPIILGIGTLLTVGLGAFFCALLFGWGVSAMDRRHARVRSAP
ncbi:MAG: ABC-type transport system involved in multi-copper enzyme maturation permease subunit [Verrucomicrobiales bacterium]|jgi:ABC-type transport system involved in multi-copper enzyme maturation permease subunit